MTTVVSPFDETEVAELKDPARAAFLAFLIPGLGHLYQGRRAKAALFFIVILGTFVLGLILGGNSKIGWGRVVYVSSSPLRWHYFCQVGVGLPAAPALLQAAFSQPDKAPWLGGFMAPPARREPQTKEEYWTHPSENTLHYELDRFFELGTVFTMVAGMLNILVIYDAWAGPFWTEPKRKRKAPKDVSAPA